jgi:hypothetical protein
VGKLPTRWKNNRRNRAKTTVNEKAMRKYVLSTFHPSANEKSMKKYFASTYVLSISYGVGGGLLVQGSVPNEQNIRSQWTEHEFTMDRKQACPTDRTCVFNEHKSAFSTKITGVLNEQNVCPNEQNVSSQRKEYAFPTNRTGDPNEQNI